MIAAKDFISSALAHRLDFFTGVPCSILTPLLNGILSDQRFQHIGATHEGEAAAIAAGAWLAGKKPTIYCQNSGLGNTVNPLSSLHWLFQIPILMLVTWRGQPGKTDAPQHQLMGRITHPILASLEIEYAAFPADPDHIEPTLELALESMEQRQRPFALILEKGIVEPEKLRQQQNIQHKPGYYQDLRESQPCHPTRLHALEKIRSILPESCAVIASTGKCGRELFSLGDRPQNFYQVGSMGCASAIALGTAINVQRHVVALDGDGAALMKLGNFATIGAYRPKNLIHIILDNGVHDSTGGQATVAASIDFVRVAIACSYASGTACNNLEGLQTALTTALVTPGPHLIHLRTQPGSASNLDRPNTPFPEIARRFQAFLQST